MGVRNLKAEHGHADLAAGEGLLYCHGHFLGEHYHFGQLVVVHVEKVVNLPARYYERVALGQGVDVEKCVELIVLGAFVAGYFAGCYF